MTRYIIFLFTFLILYSCTDPKESLDLRPILTLSADSTFSLHDNLFGHFLEKCNWAGEKGADIAWSDTQGGFRKDVVTLMDSLEIPVVRFPGGTDIDYYQWTELVDGAFDRKNHARPPYDGRSGKVVSQNQLGLDEFLQLSERLDFAPLLVTNLGDAYFEKRPVAEAAEYAAALVAYCNASVNADLPEKYLKWAKLRAENGRKEPYKVPYFQVGNEIWVYGEELGADVFPIADTVLNKYYEAVSAYIEEMRTVDPSIKIIIEGTCIGLVSEGKARLGNQFDMMAYHYYTPWAMKEAVSHQGDTVNNLSPEALYYAMVSVPGFQKNSGQSDFMDKNFLELLNQEVTIAMTEWNWNGWVSGDLKKEGHKNSKLAEGLGAASILHAMMRHADVVKMGNQSMLVGNSWGINTIRIDSTNNEATLFPTGLITGLYSRYHGTEVIKSKIANNEFYEQPYKTGTLKPENKVAYLDVVVSEDDSHYYIHTINRDYRKTRILSLDARDFKVGKSYKQIQLTGGVYTDGKPESAEIQLNEKVLSFDPDNMQLSLPPHAVNIFVLIKSNRTNKGNTQM